MACGWSPPRATASRRIRRPARLSTTTADRASGTRRATRSRRRLLCLPRCCRRARTAWSSPRSRLRWPTPVREAVLARRRPQMYGVLALHRAPTDPNATTEPKDIMVKAVSWPASGKAPSDLAATAARRIARTARVVLCRSECGKRRIHLGRRTRRRSGRATPVRSSESPAAAMSSGSYPERDGASVYHTVALAGPDGKILARYRASHLPPDQTQWAKEGNDWVVVPTPIGRIGLALGEELSVPEVFGTLSALRADIIAAPMGAPSGVTMQEDPKLFNQPYPPDTPFAPMAAAKLGQTLGGDERMERWQTRFSRGLWAGAGHCHSAASSRARAGTRSRRRSRSRGRGHG